MAGQFSEEKDRAIDLVKKITNKKEVLDTTKATNKFLADEQTR